MREELKIITFCSFDILTSCVDSDCCQDIQGREYDSSVKQKNWNAEPFKIEKSSEMLGTYFVKFFCEIFRFSKGNMKIVIEEGNWKYQRRWRKIRGTNSTGQ